MTTPELSIRFQDPKLTYAINAGRYGKPYSKGLTLEKNSITYTVSIIPIPTNSQCQHTGGVAQVPIEDFNKLCINWLKSQDYEVIKCL